VLNEAAKTQVMEVINAGRRANQPSDHAKCMLLRINLAFTIFLTSFESNPISMPRLLVNYVIRKNSFQAKIK